MKTRRSGASPRRRKAFGVAGVAAAFVAALSATAASALPAGAGAGRFQRLDPAQLQQARDNASKWLPASLSSNPVNVMLQFGGDPVAVQDAKSKAQGHGGLSKAQKEAIRSQLKSQQNQARGQIEAKGGRVLYQLADAYNGVIVHTQMKDVSALSQVPGVVAVRKLQEFRPLNTNGVPYVGGPTAWADGLTGDGVTIADIDTGIDYTHADFGGPGTVSAWQDAVAHSTEAPPASLVGPAAPKVKGGFDFVGDDYNANPSSSSYQPVPHPDPNPLDCNGHGTHTAGTAAGDGVLDTGATYTGPYDGSTVSGNSWDVGPGVAPQASLLAYRVFGCAGSSEVVAAAIDRAVADGADVITMSLGSTFGDPSDPTAVASQNAVDDGVVVVAAAGNDGPSAYMTGSPAAANGVLSVAAMDGSVPSYPGAVIAGKTSDAVLDANGAAFSDGTTMPAKVLWADPSAPHTLANVSLGCNPDDYTGVTGDLVIVQRGVCARVARAVYGQKAGAAAVLMINSADSYPPFEGKITSNPDTGEQYTVTIPFFGAKSSQGANLIAEDGTTVTLTNTTVPNTGYGRMASFSSGGPRNLDSSLKPEIAAPGVSVASAGMGTGTNSVIESGTSMATPMTSGSAALVLQAHPDWTPAEIKAALMDTASNTTKLSGYNVRLAGAGVVQADQATTTVAMATTADGLDSLSYGYDPAGGDWSATRTITLHNTSGSSLTYDLATEGNGNQLGSSVSISPSSATVAAHSTADVNVTMSLSAAAVAALPSVDTFSIGPGGVLTIRGNVVATPTSSGPGIQTLHIPYLAVPRGLAGVSGTLPRFTKTGQKDTFGGSLQVANTGVHSGNAELYTWGIHDAQDVAVTPVTMDVRDAGVQAVPGAAFGLDDSDRGLVFVVNDYTPVTNQSLNEYDIAIDTNGDGQPEGFVIGVDLGIVLGGAFDGIPASFTVDAAGHVIDAFYADAPMNGSTLELPAVASELGIDAAHSAFRYGVTGFSLLTGAVDPTGAASFDAFSPALSSGDFAPLDPGASTTFDVTVDRSAFNQQRELGWLVVSLDNGDGAAQAQELPVTDASIRGKP